jgi:hypothetical protein
MGKSGGARHSTTQVRPFTLFFPGVDQALAFGHVAVIGPNSSRRLRFTFEGTNIEPREILLEEGVDYRCDHGTVRFKRGPRVASSDEAAIELYRGAGATLIEQTTIEEPGIWLLVVPLWAFKWSGEWNRYDPAGAPP